MESAAVVVQGFAKRQARAELSTGAEMFQGPVRPLWGGVGIEYTVADLWAVAVTPTEALLAKRIVFLTHELQKTASCLSPCEQEQDQAADVQSVNKNAHCS
jgi:hypothetical protein